MTYAELKEIHPETIGVFFAFSDKQFEEGVKEKHLEGQKLFSAGHGLYGTAEGLKMFMKAYDDLAARITRETTPQEVYDYEYGNHECGYTGTDEKALEIVAEYFGKDRICEVKRKRGM